MTLFMILALANATIGALSWFSDPSRFLIPSLTFLSATLLLAGFLSLVARLPRADRDYRVGASAI
jgi:hypothetical protein